MSMARVSNDDVLVGCSKKRKKKISTEATSDDLYSHKKWPQIEIGDKIDLLPLLFRNYLIKSNGERVPVSDLEDKTVALYFYDESAPDRDRLSLTSRLQKAYRKLAKKRNFEIVLVYVHHTLNTYKCTSQVSFQRRFKTMPWLALPFGDPTYKKLKRLFNYPDELGPNVLGDVVPHPTLVIIGPHGKFVEPFGEDVFSWFGTAAYPFTRESAAKIEAEEAEMLRLEMLCKDQNMFFKQKDGTKDLFSQLVGKRTILVVGSELLEYYADFFSRLQARYLNMKGTNDEFEVIHITFAKQGSPYDKHVADTPWPVAHFAMDSDEKKLICLSSGILGFDSDGRLVMRTIRPSFEWVADMDFPFHARTLEEDALIVLEDVYRWDKWDNNSDTSDEDGIALTIESFSNFADASYNIQRL